MNSLTTTYLALGSNSGDKMHWLQQALDLVFEQVGKITAVSSVYKTPAWGFEGDDFLNACIEVKTRFSAEETLEKLLEIEQKMGRERNPFRVPNPERVGYQNRNIDLDIVFFGSENLQDEYLTVPHPKMSERKFVLTPLADIAPDLVHPLKNQKVSELLENTSDTSEIEKVPEKLKTPKIDLSGSGFRYIAIEGNIGVGKTSLAMMIAEDLHALPTGQAGGKAGFDKKLVLEQFKDNFWLPKFYKNPKKHAFQLELSFLAERYKQLNSKFHPEASGLKNKSQHPELTNPESRTPNPQSLINQLTNPQLTITDYTFSKSLIFAKITLSGEEFRLYREFYELLQEQLPRPDLYVYLYQKTDRLLENIKKRGRDYEQKIPGEYLEKINRGYLDFIKSQTNLNIKTLDISELDFVNRREDYLWILKEITSEQKHPSSR